MGLAIKDSVPCVLLHNFSEIAPGIENCIILQKSFAGSLKDGDAGPDSVARWMVYLFLQSICQIPLGSSKTRKPPLERSARKPWTTGRERARNREWEGAGNVSQPSAQGGAPGYMIQGFFADLTICTGCLIQHCLQLFCGNFDSLFGECPHHILHTLGFAQFFFQGFRCFVLCHIVFLLF